MDILNTPGLAENIYQQALEVFFARKWGNRMLFSHDISHHRRVWKFARELMICTENESNPTRSIFMARHLSHVIFTTWG